MKQLLLAFLLAASAGLSAQLNATLRSNLDYTDGVNDIWGYTAPDGTEYAIVGLETGISFVSLADPDNAVEVVRIPGVQSLWRDMKTFGDYAYSVADERDEGITAFDLRFLPDSVPFRRNRYQVPGFATLFQRAHNIYIDEETGIAFTAGGTQAINGGGILMFDLNDDPMAPELIAQGPPVYAHDVYVQGDTMYASQIFRGDLALYDISDLDNIVELGSRFTPANFTHNAWTTSLGNTIFTTDERADAPVAAYDISDPTDILLLDEFRPLGSLGQGTIPHNVHVIDEYLSISYYTDGLVVADASKPDNIIEVANYDTWPGAPGGFNGAWGAYPFLPSGLTLVSDRQTGLYVVDINYVRAARLEGTISDALLGTPINEVVVSIAAPQLNEASTDALGEYRTGLATGGTYTVTFSAENYEPLTVEVDLVNGECIVLDTALSTTVPRFNVSVSVVDDETGDPIPGAAFVLADDDDRELSRMADANGRVELLGVFEGNYDLFVTQWGYQTEARFSISPSELTDEVIRLPRGYMDDFVTDEGWSVTGGASTGAWERGRPVGSQVGGVPFAPLTDAPGDIGRLAFVTGINNPGAGAGNNDIDGGRTILTSPEFRALRRQDSLVVHYQYWFANASGDTDLNDTMRVFIDNGAETVLVREYVEDGTRQWRTDSFMVAAFVAETAELRLIVEAHDLGGGHLVEAGFDNFFVTGRAIPTGTPTVTAADVEAVVFPNPTTADFQLRYAVEGLSAGLLRVTDATGRRVLERPLSASTATVRFGGQLASGVYLVELWSERGRLFVAKAIKH